MNSICKAALDAYTAHTRNWYSYADDADHFEKRIVMWEQMVACLGAFGVRIKGHLGDGSLIVCPSIKNGYEFWIVCDNGGELNVERINDHDSLRSVPYDGRHGMAHGATMAYRVNKVFHDEAIDYAYSLAEEETTLRACPGPNR